MQIEEGDAERMMKYAQLIESNCQFLSTIRHNITQRSEIHKGSLKMIEQYMSDRKSRLNIETLIQLIVQLAYFLYSSRNVVMTPLISLEDIRVEEAYGRNNEKRFAIILFYKISEQKMQELEAAKIFCDLFEHIMGHLDAYLKAKQDFTPLELEQQQCIDLFRKQFTNISDQLSHFADKQHLFFQALEQTTLFYEFSMLYRVKSCSILDYLRCDEGRLGKFKLYKRQDESLVIDYNQQKKRNKGEHEGLRNKQKEIDENLNLFFKTINEQYMELVPNKNEKEQTYRVKFYYKIKERPKYSFEESYEEILPTILPTNSIKAQDRKIIECKRQSAEMDYYIEYSSEKNFICVKLFMPSLPVNVETSDFLMFQSNVLTFEAVNVSIEISEPRKRSPEDKSPAKKILTFKGTSSFNMKQPPLQKILLLMDITMISARIYEPELNTNRFSQGGRDYQRMATISKKINHYTKLFMKCAKKVYND